MCSFGWFRLLAKLRRRWHNSQVPSEETFAERVRTARLEAGLLQHELAVEAGLSRRAIIDIEMGRVARPHRKTLIGLSEALGKPVDYFLTASD